MAGLGTYPLVHGTEQAVALAATTEAESRRDRRGRGGAQPARESAREGCRPVLRGGVSLAGVGRRPHLASVDAAWGGTRPVRTPGKASITFGGHSGTMAQGRALTLS